MFWSVFMWSGWGSTPSQENTTTTHEYLKSSHFRGNLIVPSMFSFFLFFISVFRPQTFTPLISMERLIHMLSSSWESPRWKTRKTTSPNSSILYLESTLKSNLVSKKMIVKITLWFTHFHHIHSDHLTLRPLSPWSQCWWCPCTTGTWSALMTWSARRKLTWRIDFTANTEPPVVSQPITQCEHQIGFIFYYFSNCTTHIQCYWVYDWNIHSMITHGSHLLPRKLRNYFSICCFF